MSVPIDNDKVVAILTDTTLCTGCETCVQACKETYHLGRDRMWRWQENIDSLSATRFCTVQRKPDGHYVRQQCRHCNEPACASACIVGALQKQAMGPVTYDSDRCMGCRYCMMACPFGIPRCEWASAAPKIRKCILCYPRLKEGKQPACTEACPYGATIFGTRADMLAEARRRFAAHPGRYYPFDNPSIYGEHEIGGTSVLYISSISLDFLGWKRNLGDQPLPVLTWAALRKVPPVVLGMAGVALAAGGFVVAAAVYIFGLHKYHDFARPAILTALLGYIAVAVGLLYDLGLPWHIWHPIIFPQEHSVLFEVAMCVMCYLTVLALEFSPVVLEHPLFSHRFFRWAWAWRWSRWSLWCRDGCSATSRGSTFWRGWGGWRRSCWACTWCCGWATCGGAVS